MAADDQTEARDDCYRCGYALVGIADDQPCPECGLLAVRSRRPTDELHHTRPRWLRRIALGAWLILLAILTVPAWPFVWAAVDYWLDSQNWSVTSYRFQESGWLYLLEVSASLLLAGTWLLTSREGYAPADDADRLLRDSLRVAAVAPLAALALTHVEVEVLLLSGNSAWGGPNWSPVELFAVTLATIGCVPLPLLLFRQLRGLAARARSAHLAEHCTIVGVGTSATLVYLAILLFVLNNAERLGFGDNWQGKSDVALALILSLAVAGTLFPLWSLYLLGSFAVAFRRAARQRRGHWVRDDRSLALPTS